MHLKVRAPAAGHPRRARHAGHQARWPPGARALRQDHAPPGAAAAPGGARRRGAAERGRHPRGGAGVRGGARQDHHAPAGRAGGRGVGGHEHRPPRLRAAGGQGADVQPPEKHLGRRGGDVRAHGRGAGPRLPGLRPPQRPGAAGHGGLRLRLRVRLLRVPDHRKDVPHARGRRGGGAPAAHVAARGAGAVAGRPGARARDLRAHARQGLHARQPHAVQRRPQAPAAGQ